MFLFPHISSLPFPPVPFPLPLFLHISQFPSFLTFPIAVEPVNESLATLSSSIRAVYLLHSLTTTSHYIEHTSRNPAELLSDSCEKGTKWGSMDIWRKQDLFTYMYVPSLHVRLL